jgi:hypothetical protein
MAMTCRRKGVQDDDGGGGDGDGDDTKAAML